MSKSQDVVKQIRKATRRKFSAEEKIPIVLEGLRGAVPVSELCRREGIVPTVYYRWSKTFKKLEIIRSVESSGLPDPQESRFNQRA